MKKIISLLGAIGLSVPIGMSTSTAISCTKDPESDTVTKFHDLVLPVNEGKEVERFRNSAIIKYFNRISGNENLNIVDSRSRWLEIEEGLVIYTLTPKMENDVETGEYTIDLRKSVKNDEGLVVVSEEISDTTTIQLKIGDPKTTNSNIFNSIEPYAKNRPVVSGDELEYEYLATGVPYVIGFQIQTANQTDVVDFEYSFEFEQSDVFTHEVTTIKNNFFVREIKFTYKNEVDNFVEFSKQKLILKAKGCKDVTILLSMKRKQL